MIKRYCYTALTYQVASVFWAHGLIQETFERKHGSDLDLAFYLNEKPSHRFYRKAMDIVGDMVPHVRCDIGILNHTEPVYRFEALKGKLLFARDMDRFAGFFSLTCREYESQMFDYEKQLRYRKEAAHAV